MSDNTEKAIIHACPLGSGILVGIDYQL